MNCEAWNERLVARIYEEIDPYEDRELDRHLAECTRCREELVVLQRTRAALAESAPDVPAAPRVVVLGRTRRRFGGWTGFAAGLAAATATFALGVAAGQRFFPATSGEFEPVARGVDRAELEQILEAHRSELEARFASATPPSGDTASVDPQVTKLAKRIDDLASRTEAQRRRDLEFVLGRILAGEVQAGNAIGQTQDAVRTLAVSNHPQYVAW